MLPIEITRPFYLLLLLPAGALIAWYFYKSLSDLPHRQRVVSLIVRFLLVTCIVLALAGVYWLSSTNRLYVVFAVDQSESISEEGRKAADSFIQEALKHQGNHQVAWLPFAKEPWQFQTQQDWEVPNTKSAEPLMETAQLSAESQLQTPSLPAGAGNTLTSRDGTNLASAIEVASGGIPPGFVPRIVLLSDGNETLGDSRGAATRTTVPVYTVPLPTRSDPEVQVSAVTVPAEVQEGAPFFVDVSIYSNHDDEGMVEVYRGDHKVFSERKKLATGENKFRFQQSIERDRLAAFSVRVSGLAQDTLLDNNMESGLVFASGKPRVLVIESDPNLIREFAYALEDEGIQVDVRPPQGMPDNLADLQNYECLILSNVPATDLSTQQMQVARTYVQDLGGGFIMLGGEQSFGLGGYFKSALEDILPVRSDFEKEKEKPSLGMVLVIDRSGSMMGDCMEMAKTAARGAVELLGPRDYVGVIAFDGSCYVVSEMQSASNKARICDEISRIEAEGGTNMFPAMEMAYEFLNSTQAKLKHAILLTDGQSMPGDFEGLAQQMANSKMTVSAVAVGEGADAQLMESISRAGKGRYYHTTDPSQMPQIFAKETVTASKSAIDEQPFIPQTIRATHALKDLDMETAPFLLGYVMTRPKPTSEVILATEKGDPLLAWWRYGLGMTAAFTSDAKARWAAEWMTWPGYGKFWTQVVRQTMRKNDTKGIQVSLARHQDSTDVLVDAVSEVGQFVNDAQVDMTVIQPGFKQVHALLQQSAPGKYAGLLDTLRPGAYHVDITVKQGGVVKYRQSRGLMVGYSDELRIRPTNMELLDSIATQSKGVTVTEPSQIFDSRNASAIRPYPLWGWFLALAAFLLLLDIALRRIDFSLHWPFAKI